MYGQRQERSMELALLVIGAGITLVCEKGGADIGAHHLILDQPYVTTSAAHGDFSAQVAL